MGIDTLGARAINIERISIEKPIENPDRTFDPDKDLPKSIWEETEKVLGNFNFDTQINTYPKWLILAYYTKTISAGRFDKLGLDEHIWEAIQYEFRLYRRYGLFTRQRQIANWEYSRLGFLLEEARLLKPDKILYKNQKDHDEDMRQVILNGIEEIEKYNNIPVGLACLEGGKFPDYIDKDRLFALGLNTHNSRRPNEDNTQDWRTFGYTATELRLMFPERFKELNIKPEDIIGIKNDLKEKIKWNKMRNNSDLSDILDEARMLSVLTAKDIEFNDTGYRIIPKKQPEKEIKEPIPEERNY